MILSPASPNTEESRIARNRLECDLGTEGGTRSQCSKAKRTGHFPRRTFRLQLLRVRSALGSQAFVAARCPVVAHFQQINTFGQCFEDRHASSRLWDRQSEEATRLAVHMAALAEQLISLNLHLSMKNPLGSFIWHLKPLAQSSSS